MVVATNLLTIFYRFSGANLYKIIDIHNIFNKKNIK